MFLPTGVIHVTTATSGKEKSMSTNAIVPENGSNPEAAAPKGERKAKEARPAEWSRRQSAT
jgi:hypothetical protein